MALFDRGSGNGPTASGSDPEQLRFAISDIHGYADALEAGLHEHGLIGSDDCWVGGPTRVWFLGDYVDRGHRGLDVMRLIRKLEQGAAASGGQVRPLLGNHELQFLAALHFGDQHLSSDGRTTWRAGWRRYGGVESELQAVDDATVDWMTRLALVDVDGDDLLLHTDTDDYLRLGRTAGEVNAAGREILANRRADEWALLHRILTRRGGFREPGSPERLLSELGARRVVHGHNSLIGGFGLPEREARVPFSYASGQALAIDGGVFEGGSLVVARL